MRRFHVRLALLAVPVLVACSSSNSGEGGGNLNDAGYADGSLDGDDGAPFDTNSVPFDGDFGTDGQVVDLKTCAGAAAAKSYVGCDYWPTVVANSVWNVFDYAVVVANAGADPADVTVTGPGISAQNVTVAPGTLQKIYLPWVTSLKGPDSDACGNVVPIPGSVLAKKSAYHLVSTKPVTVYQFNALEYTTQGGPSGKDWSSCPGSNAPPTCQPSFCFSYSNDASLLLPSTAMTGNYVVSGIHGWSHVTADAKPVVGAYATITATADGTVVTLKVGAKGSIVAGTGINAAKAGDIVTLNLDAGDVAELVGAASATSDLSGSLIEATKPIQVITGAPCIENPIGTKACDHVEESNFPIETTGKHYVIAKPSGAGASIAPQTVRFYGFVDGTHLTYSPASPAGAPATLNAGDVFEIASSDEMEVTGDQAFAIATFLHGADETDPDAQRGDPSQSLVAAVEQFRKQYVFLAPDDYEENYADVVAPAGTSLTIDGAAVTSTFQPIGGNGYGVFHVTLGAGNGGAHVLQATNPVGLQVVGYGSYTSYQYPGGLNLDIITDSPPPIR